ncbi:MAG: MFS transporter [Pirellulaceae bacterium]|nr:MFS transporter [Pirellulaceae bacterium]
MSLAAPPRPVLRRETSAPTALDSHPLEPPSAPVDTAPPHLPTVLAAVEATGADPRAGARALRLHPRPRHDMRASIGDAASYSVMVGIGETYLAAFALALGTGETFAGLIATMPMLFGAALQLATPWALRRFGSYRTWVVLCASLQATALLLVPLAAWLRLIDLSLAAAWVFVAATAYWAASQATGPAWNTWIEEIIPKPTRARFFACRARISQLCTLIGFAAGGLALHFAAQAGTAREYVLPAFVTIFLVGAGCRFLSAGFLSRQSDPSRGHYQDRPVSLRQIVSQTSGDVGGRLVLYLLAMQTAVQISGPYFTPFMLAEEGMSYFTYMVLIGVCFLGKAVALPMWGRVAHAAGARRLLWIGGCAIVPIAGLWIFSDVFDAYRWTVPLELCGWRFDLVISGEMLYIGSIQLISGIVWAAYELAMLLMFFEAIPKQDRAGVLTFYNFGNAAALVLGSLIGAALLQTLGEDHRAYLILFACSSLARLLTVPLLLRMPEKVIEVVQPAVRVVAVRPSDGGLDRPILSSLSEGEHP